MIVSACDENFAPHFATLLHSAWHHNRDARFLLLDCGIEEGTAQRLRQFAADLGAALETRRVDLDRFAEIGVGHDWPIVVFARLLIPELLSCAKALYLDSDCIVTADLSPLWNTDMSGYYVAGVADRDALKKERRRNPHLPYPATYFNAGVMLMNLDAWREHDVAGSVVSYVREYAPFFGEQTGINVVAAGKALALPETWNFMLHRWSRKRATNIVPSIIHCTGRCKPWQHANAVFIPVYLLHRNATPFPIAPPRECIPSRVRIFLNLALLRPKYWQLQRATRYNDNVFSRRYIIENKPPSR